MPHTNNAAAKARKANRTGNKPAFLMRKSKPAKVVVGVDELPLPPSPDAGNPSDPTTTFTNPISSKDRASPAALITEYHALEKKLAAEGLDPLERKKLLARQEELGGLKAYQDASVHGGDNKRGGESGKWCVGMLKELKVGVPKEKGKAVATMGEDGKMVYPKIVKEKLRLLDVGAIAGTSYADWSWIETTCIDLNPQADHVLKYDFFDYPPPPSNRLFDVVGLSLVLNFVGSLKKRAEMLSLAHSFLKPEGLLYLVLPLPCLTNSRYTNHERFTSILKTLGWESVRQRDTARLTYWLLKRGPTDDKIWRREEVRGGAHRNNFCIIHGSGADVAVEEEVEGVAMDVEEEEEYAGDGMKVKVAPKVRGTKGKAAVVHAPAPAWEGIEEAEVETEWGGIGGDDSVVEAAEEEWGGIETAAAAGDDVADEEWGGC